MTIVRVPLQARFQGQFLNDEDVGQKPAPTRPPGESLRGSEGDPFVSATTRSGEDILSSDGAHEIGGASESDAPESLASRRRRLGLGEGRRGSAVHSKADYSESPQPQSQLLEIKPKKKIQAPPTADEASAESDSMTSLSHSKAATEASRVGPGSMSTTKRPASAVPPPLRLSLSGDEDINDDEFQQSLRMRSSVDYIHPSVVGMLSAGSKAASAAASAPASGYPRRGQEGSNAIVEEDIPFSEARSSLNNASSEMYVSGMVQEASASRMRAEASKRIISSMDEGTAVASEPFQDEELNAVLPTGTTNSAPLPPLA